ncbi:hypothetical protein V8C42DRAFT_336698 [Trichoderma barbatum]
MVEAQERALAMAVMPSPPSTAPAAVSSHPNRLTAAGYGLQHIQQLGDSLIPGQPRPRAYQRAVQMNVPTPSPLPEAAIEAEEIDFAVNDLEFNDHFESLVHQALQQAAIAP